VSEGERRRRIENQSVLASRCKRCGHIFVVNRKLMGHDKPDLDPRIVHLRECLKNMKIERLRGNFERIKLLGEYTGQKTVFFDELYLTQEQIDKLCKKLSDWLHSDTNT